MNKETAKIIVRIISILYFISAAASFVFAILSFVAGNFLAKFLPGAGGLFGEIISVVAIIAGIVLLVIAIIGLIVGIGLWKFKEWARIVAIVLSVIGIIGSIFSLPHGIIGLIINGAIFYLLTFQKEVVALFKK